MLLMMTMKIEDVLKRVLSGISARLPMQCMLLRAVEVYSALLRLALLRLALLRLAPLRLALLHLAPQRVALTWLRHLDSSV